MSDNPLASILEMDGEERYDYFLDAVVEERELWILVNGDNQFLKIVPPLLLLLVWVDTVPEPFRT